MIGLSKYSLLKRTLKMNQRNLIGVTLLVSALAFNPLTANELNTNSITQRQTSSVTGSIAHILHKRGIDEDVAYKISKNLTNEEDDLFAAMINNLVSEYNTVTKDEVLEYLGTAALYRQNVYFDSYSHLISMLTKIKGRFLNENDLKQLSTVAKLNQEISINKPFALYV
jgi:hypothetical protein